MQPWTLLPRALDGALTPHTVRITRIPMYGLQSMVINPYQTLFLTRGIRGMCPSLLHIIWSQHGSFIPIKTTTYIMAFTVRAASSHLRRHAT